MPGHASPRTVRFAGTMLAAACTLVILLAAAPSLADGWRHRGWGGHHGHHRHHHGGISGTFVWDLSPPPYPVVIPGPAYPAPLYPAPVYVAPPQMVTPVPQGYCREYTSTSIVAGRPVQTFGTACLQPDGSWRIVSAY